MTSRGLVAWSETAGKESTSSGLSENKGIESYQRFSLCPSSHLTSRLTGGIPQPPSSTHHVILVLHEDGKFFEERNNQHQELLVIAFQNFDQQANNVFIPHLQLCSGVFSEVQQEVKRDWEKGDMESREEMAPDQTNTKPQALAASHTYSTKIICNYHSFKIILAVH